MQGHYVDEKIICLLQVYDDFSDYSFFLLIFALLCPMVDLITK